MNKEVKENWVTALTSGEYEQGAGHLRTPDNKYCCLGVLTELYRKETGKGEWTKDFEFCDISEGGANNISGIFLTDGVVKWAELSSGCPSVGDFYLHSLNDGGTSFAEIARQIDEGL